MSQVNCSGTMCVCILISNDSSDFSLNSSEVKGGTLLASRSSCHQRGWECRARPTSALDLSLLSSLHSHPFEGGIFKSVTIVSYSRSQISIWDKCECSFGPVSSPHRQVDPQGSRLLWGSTPRHVASHHNQFHD